MDDIQGALSSMQPAGVLDPRWLALLQAGLTGMQSSGPSKTPTSLGQIIGQAGQAGLGAYSQGITQQRQMQQLEQQRLLQAAQIRKAQADAAKDEQATAASVAEQAYFAKPETQEMIRKGDIQGALAGMPRMTAGNLAQFAGVLNKKEAPVAIGAGGLRNPDGTITPPAPRPAAPTMNGTLRTRIDGDQSIQEEYRDGSWTQVGNGPRFARQVAPVVNVSGGRGTKAPTGYRFSSDGETLEVIPGGPKDKKGAGLPTQALKLQQAELDAIGTAAGITADLTAVNQMIDEGKIDLGLVSNLMSQARTKTGLGNEQSRNFNSFERTLEKLRNDSLRLNKGVQTEGDSVRAWNELMGSLSDKETVKQRLKEIAEINNRAINLRKMNIDVIRSNYMAEPLDVSAYETQPAAVGSGIPAAPRPSVPDAALKPQDQQALDWANANPNDPRAKTIKQRLGR